MIDKTITNLGYPSQEACRPDQMSVTTTAVLLPHNARVGTVGHETIWKKLYVHDLQNLSFKLLQALCVHFCDVPPIHLPLQILLRTCRKCIRLDLGVQFLGPGHVLPWEVALLHSEYSALQRES